MKDGELTATLKEANLIRDRMKAEGRTKAEIDRYLEGVLRHSWPQTRVWECACDDCQDTGLIHLTCTREHRCNGVSTRVDYPGQRPGKYLRLCAQDPTSDYMHDYGLPCGCRAGDKFRPAPTGGDLEDAGRQPRKPTRFGR